MSFSCVTNHLLLVLFSREEKARVLLSRRGHLGSLGHSLLTLGRSKAEKQPWRQLGRTGDRGGLGRVGQRQPGEEGPPAQARGVGWGGL